MVRDIVPGPASSLGGRGTATGSRFYYYTAMSTPGQHRIYRADGIGVVKANDLDVSSHRPLQINGRLVFFAMHPTLGRQAYFMRLWANTETIGHACASTSTTPHLRTTDPYLGSLVRVSLTSQHRSSAAVLVLGQMTPFAARVRLGACELVPDRRRSVV